MWKFLKLNAQPTRYVAELNAETITASSDAETITATYDAETITATYDAETITATYDAETITATYDAETITANDDAETITAGQGDDDLLLIDLFDQPAIFDTGKRATREADPEDMIFELFRHADKTAPQGAGTGVELDLIGETPPVDMIYTIDEIL